jgi:hypothetical protein
MYLGCFPLSDFSATVLYRFIVSHMRAVRPAYQTFLDLFTLVFDTCNETPYFKFVLILLQFKILPPLPGKSVPFRCLKTKYGGSNLY